MNNSRRLAIGGAGEAGADAKNALAGSDTIRCMVRTGCSANALDDSNYCEAHRPVPEQAPTPSLRWMMVTGGVIAALFIWLLPALNTYIGSRIAPEKVQTFALSVRCRMPLQHEQVVVLVRDAGAATQRNECSYVAGRGAYGAAK